MIWGTLASGAAGQSVLWRGEYDPAVTYNPYDSVSYQGSSYICTETTIGVAPIPATTSNPPPLATTGNRGSIAALPTSDQTSYYARGDNTWQSKVDVMPVGSVLQVVTAVNVTWFSSNVIIPYDDTIPQWGEGVVLMPLTITPVLSNSKIRLCCDGVATESVVGTVATFAMFRGTGPSAISATPIMPAAIGSLTQFVVKAVDTPGAGTFIYTVRYGPHSIAGGSVIVVNGNGSARALGGSMGVTFWAEEVKQ